MALTDNEPQLRPDGGVDTSEPLDAADLHEGDHIVLEPGPNLLVTRVTPDPMAARDEPDWKIAVTYEDGFETTIDETHLETIADDVVEVQR